MGIPLVNGGAASVELLKVLGAGPNKVTQTVVLPLRNGELDQGGVTAGMLGSGDGTTVAGFAAMVSERFPGGCRAGAGVRDRRANHHHRLSDREEEGGGGEEREREEEGVSSFSTGRAYTPLTSRRAWRTLRRRPRGGRRRRRTRRWTWSRRHTTC
mmetsp:Transcript_14391/g.34605  ORF Transcript_14391/g.34605 Transcript_14391/m.34605 type:complete len:156 (-) Transcript_14391:681-1148(-)